MNEIIEGLEEIKERVEKEAKKWERVTDYCIVCGIFLDDPSRFTCGHPQCDRELLALSMLLKEHDVKTAKELEEHIDSLQNDLEEALEELGVDTMDDFRELKKQPPTPSEEELETKGLLDDLEADSIEEARKKVEKMRDLIKEISQKLEGRKSGG